MNKIKEIAAILLVVSSTVGCGLYRVEGESFSEIKTTAETTEVQSLSTTSPRCVTSTATTLTTKVATRLTTTVTTTEVIMTTTSPSTTPTSEETEELILVDIDTSPEETGTTPEETDIIDDTEIIQEEPTESDAQYTEEDTYYITDYERELLAEVVEHEAGSDWISCYDKACCVAAIMNRVREGCWGGSDIYSVLTAPNQFSGFYPGYCTAREGAYQAVDYYFANPDEFSTTITSWSGDGYMNYFY